MSKDNSSEILEVAKNYYDKMQIVYDEAIKREDALQYFRQKQREYKDDIKIDLPTWLITALESEDYWHFQIIQNEAQKKKRENG